MFQSLAPSVCIFKYPQARQRTLRCAWCIHWSVSICVNTAWKSLYKYQSGYYMNSVMESANFVVVLKISIGCTFFFSHNFLSHHDEVYPSVSMWQMMSFPHVWKKNAARRWDSGLVTPCWITGMAPPVLLWTTPKSRVTAYHLRRNRPAQYTLGESHADAEKKWSPQHSCAPCVALSVSSSGWRQWTPSLLCRADVPSQNAHSHVWKSLFSKSAHADT